ncbi:MAG: flagellar basal body P-ring formation protein FlgA [Bdellovibrionales bacterium]|nr:flagellar basal body P-ring formation protein FlgA [Bdellovibrionales bacterium]
MKYLVVGSFILGCANIGVTAESIRFKSNAFVTSDHVNVSDLLVNPELVSSDVREMPLGELRDQESLEIDSSEVARVSRLIGEGKDYTFYIPSNIRVKRVSSTDYLKNLVSEKVKDLYEAEEVDIDRISISSKSVPKRANVDFRKMPTNGTFAAEIVDVSDSNTKAGFVSGTYRVSKRVPVARRNMQIGEPIQMDDYEFEIRDVTNEVDTFPSRIKLVSSEMKRARTLGQPIRLGDLKAPRLVKRGETVRALFKGNNWKIQFSGVAQGDGSQGEQIEIMNMNNKKKMMARIVEQGLVEVD